MNVYLLEILGPCLIALIMMRISITRKSVKIATKSQNVVCTAATLTLDTAAFTGSNPSITHG